MLGFSDTVARRRDFRMHNPRRILTVFAVMVCAFNTATAQNATLSDIPSLIDPLPAPGFAGGSWLNNPTADEEFLSGKVVLVNFWATWCPPCIKELPSIQKLWTSLDREDFEVVAVNVGEKQTTVEHFLDNFNPNLEFAIILDTNLEVYKNWGVRPVPTTYIVDRENNRRYRGLGEFDFDSAKIRSLIQQLIQESFNSR